MIRSAIIAAITGALVLVVLIMLANVWRECRDFGHSFTYCVRMVTR